MAVNVFRPFSVAYGFLVVVLEGQCVGNSKQGAGKPCKRTEYNRGPIRVEYMPSVFFDYAQVA